jgi:hypothetical protein
VPTARLELAQPKPLPPQDSVSTNFTTSAFVKPINSTARGLLVLRLIPTKNDVISPFFVAGFFILVLRVSMGPELGPQADSLRLPQEQ